MDPSGNVWPGPRFLTNLSRLGLSPNPISPNVCLKLGVVLLLSVLNPNWQVGMVALWKHGWSSSTAGAEVVVSTGGTLANHLQLVSLNGCSWSCCSQSGKMIWVTWYHDLKALIPNNTATKAFHVIRSVDVAHNESVTMSTYLCRTPSAKIILGQVRQMVHHVHSLVPVHPTEAHWWTLSGLLQATQHRRLRRESCGISVDAGYNSPQVSGNLRAFSCSHLKI